MTRGRAILGIGTGERMGNEAVRGGLVQTGGAVRRSPGNHPSAVELGRDPGQPGLPVLPVAQRNVRPAPGEGHLARDLDRLARTADAARDGSLRRWVVPGGDLQPGTVRNGLGQVQTAADDAHRDPDSIIAANGHFVVTGRSAGEIEEALDSVPIRACVALNAPAHMWAEHDYRHPLGDDYTGFQDLVAQTLDEQTVLAHAAAVPMSCHQAMVETLLDRGAESDVAEAEAAIERLADADHDDGLPVRDIWLLRLRALLARAHGDTATYSHLRDRHRDMARTLCFEGHIAWAETTPLGKKKTVLVEGTFAAAYAACVGHNRAR